MRLAELYWLRDMSVNEQKDMEEHEAVNANDLLAAAQEHITNFPPKQKYPFHDKINLKRDSVMEGILDGVLDLLDQKEEEEVAVCVAKNNKKSSVSAEIAGFFDEIKVCKASKVDRTEREEDDEKSESIADTDQTPKGDESEYLDKINEKSSSAQKKLGMFCPYIRICSFFEHYIKKMTPCQQPAVPISSRLCSK